MALNSPAKQSRFKANRHEYQNEYQKRTKPLILLVNGTLDLCSKTGSLPHETVRQTPIPTLASNNLRRILLLRGWMKTDPRLFPNQFTGSSLKPKFHDWGDAVISGQAGDSRQSKSLVAE